MPAQNAEILLVEDSPSDARLTKLALQQAQAGNHLNVVTDGQEAVDFLMRRGKHSESPRPDLILLDWNLPKLNGEEVLRWLKQQPEFQQIPVVVLTTSRAQRDVSTAYELHANCYLVKPFNLDSFMDLVRGCEQFWLSTVMLPSRVN